MKNGALKHMLNISMEDGGKIEVRVRVRVRDQHGRWREDGVSTRARP